MIYSKPSGAEIKIFRRNQLNTMAVDSWVICVNMSSAVIVIKTGHCLCWGRISTNCTILVLTNGENVNICLNFPQIVKSAHVYYKWINNMIAANDIQTMHIWMRCDIYIYIFRVIHWARSSETWWRHQMERFSALLALCAGNSPVPVNSPRKGQWRGALMFSLIYVWINGWVNNHEAGDLWR